MANWNLYETRMTIDGNTERDNQINTIKNSVLNNFANSPSYFLTLRNGIEQGFNIVEENEIIKNPNKKRVICRPDETIIVGDIIEFDNSNWICTENDTTSEICDIGIISKSNNTLLFYPSQSNENPISNELIEIPCIVGKGNINLDTNKFLSIPADENLIICPNNSNSSYINENTRFILSGSAYIVQGIDNISNVGLLNIRVKQDQISADDNLELGIANYWSNQSIKEVYILNGTSASLLYTNATLQLDIECKDNGLVVENPIVSYISDNTYVCTVDENGLITANGTGDAIITVSYGIASASITIHSEMVVNDNYNIVITPTDDILKLSRSISLTAHAMKNGVEDLTRHFVWSLSNKDGSSNVYATITQNDNVCVVLANSLSSVANKYVIVRCELTTDNTVYTDKEIKIINLF